MLKTLCDCGIPVRILPTTESEKHVWARDYMPIQIDKDTFLLYQYSPDYLKDDQDYIPDYRTICHEYPKTKPSSNSSSDCSPIVSYIR